MATNSVAQVMDGVVAGMETFPDISHVVLTVRDLDRSVPWYCALFGEDPDHVDDGDPIRAAVWMLPSAAVALHEFVDQTRTEAFDERRPGLDHVAFRCTDRSELEAWAVRLDALGVAHGEIVDAPYGSGLAFRDPDNIALEFFAPSASLDDRSEGRNQ